MKDLRISILGCGWLGFPLAISLVKEGYQVKGSTTSAEKLHQLSSCHIDPYLVHFDPYLRNKKAADFFDSDLLIINIPPKGQPDEYLAKLNEVSKKIKEQGIRRVIYISSTSVYGDSNNIVNEQTPAIPETAAGKAIFQVEQLLKLTAETSIIRFAGLVGPGRHPGRFLAGKSNLPNGDAPVNLIHLDDCIGIIKALIHNETQSGLYIGCSPDHPSRKEFYTEAARLSNLPQPHFTAEKINWKEVDGSVVSRKLNYTYQIYDWLHWLERNS